MHIQILNSVNVIKTDKILLYFSVQWLGTIFKLCKILSRQKVEQNQADKK